MVYIDETEEQDQSEPAVEEVLPVKKRKKRFKTVRWAVIGAVCGAGAFCLLCVVAWMQIRSFLQ